jgi:hypothetical protein
MVWHSVVLPGTHTVTVVYSVLMLLLLGPALTVTANTFDAGATVVVVEEPESGLDPPQEAMARVSRRDRAQPAIRWNAAINAAHPRKHRRAALEANTPVP